MDKALVFGTKDCRFESCQAQYSKQGYYYYLLLLTIIIIIIIIITIRVSILLITIALWHSECENRSRCHKENWSWWNSSLQSPGHRTIRWALYAVSYWKDFHSWKLGIRRLKAWFGFGQWISHRWKTWFGFAGHSTSLKAWFGFGASEFHSFESLVWVWGPWIPQLKASFGFGVSEVKAWFWVLGLGPVKSTVESQNFWVLCPGVNVGLHVRERRKLFCFLNSFPANFS